MANKDPTEPHNMKWTTPKVTAALNKLVERKSTHQIGNGWKSTVWLDVSKAVHAANLDTNPPKDQTKLISKLEDLKKTFELYIFVEKFSGSGWDEDEKHASNTPEYTCIVKENTAATSVTSASPTASPAASTSNLKSTGSVDTAGDVTLHALMLVLDNMHPDGEAMGGLNNYDDELCLSPPQPPTKCTHAESDDATNPKPKRPRVKSNSSSSSSTATRNAEADSQIALSFNKLSDTMAKPIITTTDVSYVDDMICLFNIVSLTESPIWAHLFVITQSTEHCKGMIAGVLEADGIVLPEDY
ncbi:hypothetical protein B0H14DRAFT_3526201 [Mycena olivaceomarginata]|nr:hypothetical protein B0H14DRAFT_3526201 [Mycena olivaceomarginata]